MLAGVPTFTNSQGFRKVDPDKWEFANEGFLRGNKHLLKNIHRRKSPQGQQSTSCGGSSSEIANPRLGIEIERLREERSVMMQEVIELQQNQRGTSERMELVKGRLHASEKTQKQMVSFLAKVLQKPEYMGHLKQVNEKPRRKFLKQKHQETGCSTTSMVKFKPEFPDFGDSSSEFPDYLLQSAPFGAEEVQIDDLSFPGELTETPSLVAFPEDLAKERTFPEVSSSGIENMIKQEEVWSMGFDLSTDISGSSPDLWGNTASCHIPEIGPLHSGEFSDILDLGSLPAVSSGIEKWADDEYPPV